jgi:hypothetical protein
MSNYSEKIEREKQKGLYKVSDFEGGREVTHIMDQLLEDMMLFDRQMDILTFSDTAKQLQLNVTNGAVLIELFGPEPGDWTGHRITLFVQEYKEGKFGIRIRSAETKLSDGSLPANQDLDDSIPF